jgi:ADP-ribose pyrophosphatase
LIVNAFKQYDQKLDDTEEIRVHLADFVEFGDVLMRQELPVQLFTACLFAGKELSCQK